MKAEVPATTQGFLFDLDGTLFLGDEPYPGAVDLLRSLRAKNFKIGFLSNITRMRRAGIVERLQKMGFEAHEKELVTPSLAASQILRSEGKSRVMLLLAQETKPDFSEFTEDGENPQSVVVGDLGDGFLPSVLDRAFLALFRGADLLALQKQRYWRTPAGLRVDVGGYVSLLEYSSGKKARVVGKPEPDFFQAALKSLDLPAEKVLMVGDDIYSDVQGAQRAGIRAALVKSGKYSASELRKSQITPDLLLDSIADLA